MSKPEYAIGIDFGGTSVKMARISREGKIEARADFSTAECNGVEGWLAAVEKRVAELREGAQDGAVELGIGVGIPGFVDFDRGFINELVNVPGWKDVPLGDFLRARFGERIAVDNDVNALAAGECMFGAGRHFQHAVFVALGTGVGGGLLLNGKVYRGAYSMAGEIGHMPINMEGPQNIMGKGGVELYIGNRRLIERAQKALADGRESSILERAGGQMEAITPKIIAEAAADGDALAREIFDFAADCLATMLSGLTYALQPQAFILGGGVAAAGEILYAPLQRHLAERVNPIFLSRLEIRPAELGTDAGVIGAAALIFSSINA